MSEQAARISHSGTGSETSAASTGRFRLQAGGNAEPSTGNALPGKVPEKLDLQILARRLNIASRTIGHDLHFEVDLDNGHAVIQVLDSETGEIIRQIPPEKASMMIRPNGAFQIRLFDALV